jgi:phosphatidylserine/phosphatidylglycerophosphate/cardiolipin synthase-like enzyme
VRILGWVLLLLLWIMPAAHAVEVPASGTVEALFTPWDDAEGTLLHEIGGARHTVHVQAYLVTSRNIARALTMAYRRGVQVELLADREMMMKGENSQVPHLAAAGIPIWLETRYAAAHNKIIIIDADDKHPVVMTGSYNFTFSAQARNAENLLVLRGNRPLARSYLTNWQRHRAEAVEYRGEPLQ